MKSLTKFLKRYGYYVVGLVLLLAIGVTALMTATGNKINDGGVIDVGTDTISFRLPMNNLTVIKEYTPEELIFNKTLAKYTNHKAYSLTSEDLKVFSVARGTVEEIGNSFELGKYIILAHEDGLKSYYGSLDQDVFVSKGSTVEKGQVLGTASDSAENYSLEGNHLFFRMYNGNELVDPAQYLNFGNK
jgi:hypothetical protein